MPETTAWARQQKLNAVLLLGGACIDCGFDDLERLEVFQFDHRPGAVKLGNVGRMFQGASKARIEAEVKNCDLVCANCHSTRTHRRVRE